MSNDIKATSFVAGLLSPLLVPVGALLVAPIILLRAWVLTLLWGRYLAPALHTPALGLAPALGATLAAHLLTWRVPAPGSRLGRSIFDSALAAVTVMFIGWFGTFFL